MTRWWAAISCGLLAMASSAGHTQPADKPVEAAYDAEIKAEDQRGWIEQMASAPNHVGSPHDRANAEFLLASFRKWGWDARIERFDVLYPTPISTSLELIAPERIALGGQEPAVAGDRDPADTLPPYVAYQGDGDVTADLVYVNYGLPDDYLALERRGVDVRGKIVIARYGGGWRGLKPKLAQEHGALGCIIYSDPADDGYARGATYPDGGARPEGGVQRGSVLDVTVYPGDPLTPGEPSVRGTKRLARADAVTIMKIPTLPISYRDARQLLARIGGPLAPPPWRGALPFAYRMGGAGAVQLRLSVKSEWATKPLYNVIATLKGARYPDEWVIRGNHFDAWNYGAWDPLSGLAAMMSEAKALGALTRRGWRPARTIVYTAWDGEEPSMLGSTEWAEAHAAELRKKAVVYINSDSNGRGLLIAGGTASFQGLVTDAATDVIDPETGASVAARKRAGIRAGAFERTGFAYDAIKAAAEKSEDLPLDALGAGSDFVAFTHHLGLPTIYLGFGGEAEGGTYHSIYDNYRQFTSYTDPGLKYGVAASQLVGRVVLRLADADTPPRRFSDFPAALRGYVTEIKALADQQRSNDAKRTALISDRSFTLASDPLTPVKPPVEVAATPSFDFATLDKSVTRLDAAAKAFDNAYAAHASELKPQRRRQLNAQLRDIDQLLLDDRGLPGRPWYRNLIAAPGRFTGYTAKTLPGVREAIEERRFADVPVYIGRTAAVLDAYSARLEAATRTLTEPSAAVSRHR